MMSRGGMHVLTRAQYRGMIHGLARAACPDVPTAAEQVAVRTDAAASAT